MSASPISKQRIQKLTLSAVLIAFAVLIPLVMPVKVIIGPASFTLASHVPVFLAVFISPGVAIAVALGAGFGFFMAGFPFVIVMRAFSHLLFAVVGAYLIQKHPDFLLNWRKTLFLALGLNAIHGLAEFLVVLMLTVSGSVPMSYWLTLIVLIGIGSVIHGLIDFYLAYYCWKFLKTAKSI
ncbi:hypothetical protein [Streptococcus devriesei]|uniref:hypothetical protein n=1 Tax=Streptococcus devriesei TaxID=231233 RepID=UPI0003FB0153|nr:hypothetical protein [Streptococcus devriesei]